MSKFIQLSAIISLTILAVGCLVAPNNPTFWLADASRNYMFVRLGLITLIVGLLVTSSNKSRMIKPLILAGGLTFAGWALIKTYQETIQTLDGLSFAISGIALAILAAEPAKVEADSNFPVRYGLGRFTKPVFLSVEQFALAYAMLIMVIISIASTRLGGSTS